MAEKFFGLLCFMFATTAVTCFHFDQGSFDLVKNNFRDSSSAKKWDDFNRLIPYSFQHNGFKYSMHDLLESPNYRSEPKKFGHPIDFRKLHKGNFQNFGSRHRNYLQQFTDPPIRKLIKLNFNKKAFEGTFNSFDKKPINFVNSDSDFETVTDLNYSTKETDVKNDINPINHSRLSSYTPTKFSFSTDHELISSVSSKPSVTSSIDLKSLDKQNNSIQELVTDSDIQATETDVASTILSSLTTLTSEDSEQSENPEDEKSTNKNLQVKDNQRDFTTNIVLSSSENNQVSTAHLVFNTETSNGFVTNHISSNSEKGSFFTDTEDSSISFTTEFVSDSSKSLSSSSTSETFNEIEASETSLNLDKNTNVNVGTNSYPPHLTDDAKVSLGESSSFISTMETKQSTILPAETSSSTENAWTGTDTTDKSSTNYFNPSSSTDKVNPFKYLKSTTVHEVTDYAVKSTSDPVKSKMKEDVTNGIHFLTDSTPSRDRFVEETIPQDHVITDSTIRTARIAISVIFLSVALIAVAVLSIYLLRIRRNTVEYDQLLLLP